MTDHHPTAGDRPAIDFPGVLDVVARVMLAHVAPLQAEVATLQADVALLRAEIQTLRGHAEALVAYGAALEDEFHGKLHGTTCELRDQLKALQDSFWYLERCAKTHTDRAGGPPLVRFRGRWTEGRVYQPGHISKHQGCLWVCTVATATEPAVNRFWHPLAIAAERKKAEGKPTSPISAALAETTC